MSGTRTQPATWEQRQADAARALVAAAADRQAAQRELDRATEWVRHGVLAARAAGISVRRAAELGEVSPSTVTEWESAARAAEVEEARERVRQAADPARRGWYLVAAHRDICARPPRVRANGVAAVIHAAYAVMLRTRADLAPQVPEDADLEDVAAALAPLDSAAWTLLRDVGLTGLEEAGALPPRFRPQPGVVDRAIRVLYAELSAPAAPAAEGNTPA